MKSIDIDKQGTEKLLCFFSKINTENKDHSYKKGDIILRQGQTIKEIYLIINGEISIKHESSQGKTFSMGKFNYNGLLGLLEIMSDKACVFSVYAESDILLKKLNSENFKKEIFNSPEMSEILLKHISLKWHNSLHSTMNRIIYNLKYNVVQDLIISYNNSTSNYIEINRKHNSQKLGSTLRAYNRILKELAADRVIFIDGNKLRIPDIEKLKSIINNENKL